MKLFRRIFLVGMLLSSTLFFFQCSSCKEDETPAPPTVTAYTALEQLVGAPKAWKISTATEDGKALVLATAGSISLSFEKNTDGSAKSFTTNIITGVPSPSGTATTGTFSVSGSSTGDLTFNPSAANQSKVTFTLTPFATDKQEYASKLEVKWTVTVPNKPAKAYVYTYTR